MGGGKSLSGLGSIPALLESYVDPDPRGQAPERWIVLILRLNFRCHFIASHCLLEGALLLERAFQLNLLAPSGWR